MIAESSNVTRSTPQQADTPAAADASPRPATAQTTAKDARLRKHADYQRVYQATRKQFSNSMTWFLVPRPEAQESTLASHSPRVGLTAGKVLGKAHERNRIKRRMREAVRHHLHELPAGIDLILHPRRSVMTMDFGKLEAEVLRIFRQAASQTAGKARPAEAAGASKSAASTQPAQS